MTVIVDNTGFSVNHWSRFTEADFIEQNLKAGIYKQYQETDRRALLQFAYQQIINDPARVTETVKRV